MSQNARRRRKDSVLVSRWIILHVISVSLVLGTGPVMANPLGGVVVNGSASIQSSGNTVTVNQATNRAVIDWQGFSIGAGETTQFNLPNNSSAVLNRVTGGNPSSLLGTLNSNGKVYLINPNGILVGNGANINVGGLVASTLDVSNEQFMKGGKLDFSGSSLKGVVNHGTVRAVDGDIYMIAYSVENHGTLHAPNGTVGLAAGQSVTLMDAGHPSLKVRPSKNSVGTTRTGITNTGLIDAVQVELVAHGNIYALAINNRGTIRATGSVERDGQVFLVAGHGGKIANSGQIIEVPTEEGKQNPDDLSNKLASTDFTSRSASNSGNNDDNAMGDNVRTGNQGGGYGNTGPGNQGNDIPNGNAGGSQGGGNQGGGSQGGGNQGGGSQGGGNQGGGNQGGGSQGGGNQGGGNQGGGNQGGGNQGGGNQGGFGGVPTHDFWERTALLAESLLEMIPNLPYYIYSEGEQKWPGRNMTKWSSAEVFDYGTLPRRSTDRQLKTSQTFPELVRPPAGVSTGGDESTNFRPAIE